MGLKYSVDGADLCAPARSARCHHRKPMPDQVHVTLPDGSVREVPAGTTGAELASQHRARTGAGRRGDPGRREIQDLSRPLVDGRQIAILTDRDAAVARRASPLRRAHSRDGRATPASRREDRLRPVDRRRLLLRLRGRRSRSRPKISTAFESEMRKVVAEKYPFVREEVNRARGAAALRRRSAQARAAITSSATTRSSRRTPTVRSSICAAARTCPTRRGSSTSS